MKDLKLSGILPLLILACAVREQPPGGPEDKTPPSIVRTVPEGGSTLLPPDAIFKITFSETMRHEKIEGAVFLSPIFWDYPEMKWPGKELTVNPGWYLRSQVTVGETSVSYVYHRMLARNLAAF